MDLKTMLLEEFETLYRLISEEEKESNDDIIEHFENIKELIERLSE